MSSKSIRRLFIANRGECACRIIRSAKKLGIYCIVAKTKDDNAPHIEYADAVAEVDSYLNAAAILKSAKHHRADAVHAGWGFLSENASFAKSVERAGMRFVGPPSSVMKKAADKTAAREFAQTLNIPTALGASGTSQTLRAAAKRIGYPVMLKAASGGGGRGMRIVHNDSEFVSAVTSAASEAKTAFADSSLLLEKYIDNAHHIEAQILCDHHGAVHVLGLRDCSMQRRRQKIIEESPPPKLSPTLSEQLQRDAAKLATALQYRNAGTVEFLVSNNKYYFLEINARLQVEHPVTEMVCDLDLVELQLRIANNESLETLKKSTTKKHAIEVRLCAENPLNDFLPDVGEVRCLMPHMPNVRVDSGLYDNARLNTIGGGYDSMLAKIIAYGKTREESRQNLQQALSHTWLCGIANNAAFLRHALSSPDFIHARVTTDWADKHANKIITQLHQQKMHAAYLTAIWQMQTCAISKDAIGLRLFSSPQSRILLYDNKQKWDIDIVQNDNNYSVQCHRTDSPRLQINNAIMQSPTTAAALGASAQLQAVIDDAQVCIQFAPHHNGVQVFYEGMCLQFEFVAPPLESKTEQNESEARAPMQSIVRKVCIRAKQKVKSGDVLFLLEAMKIELAITASRDGIIDKVLCTAGSTVAQGALLASMLDDSNKSVKNVKTKRKS